LIESSLDDLGIVIFRCTGSVTLDAIVVSSSLNRVINELTRNALGFELPVEIFDNYDVAYKWLNA